MNELTNEQREALTTRFLSLRTQAKDLWNEICDLHQEVCVHDFQHLSPLTSQCKYCFKVCSHTRAFKLTKECDDCGSELVVDIKQFEHFMARIEHGRPTR